MDTSVAKYLLYVYKVLDSILSIAKNKNILLGATSQGMWKIRQEEEKK